MRRAAVGAVIFLAACGGEVAPESSESQEVDVAAPATAAPSPPATPAVDSPSEDINASDTSPIELNMRFQALGTEPFWSVKVGATIATYTTPEDPKGTPVHYEFSFEKDILRYEWIQDARAFVLVITKGTCSDGMSDTVYKWKAALTIDGEIQQGCARQT